MGLQIFHILLGLAACYSFLIENFKTLGITLDIEN